MSIRETRVCLIWFERWSDFWKPDQDVALSFLLSEKDYIAEYEKMMGETVKMASAGKPVPAARLLPIALTPPWPYQTPKYRHWFWRYYLRVPSNKVTGNIAWKWTVPFRTGFDAKILAAKPWIQLLSDGFVYPHGIGLVLTLKLYFDEGDWSPGGMPLETAVHESIKASTSEIFEGKWSNASKFSGKIESIGEYLLDDLRARVYGFKSEEGTRTPRPFSVSAVVRGDADGTTPIENGDVHLALQGLCTRRLSWQKDNLTPFDTARLRVRKSGPKDHFLYQTANGRTIWYPNSFSSEADFQRTVGCYQRNLTLLHLQTEALIQALYARSDLQNAGASVPPILESLCKSAVGHLQALYASDTATYRSSSPRAYIDGDIAVKNEIQSGLSAYGAGPLQYQVAVT